MNRKIILSIDNLNLGGAQTQVKLLSEYLTKRNIESEIITCYPKGYKPNKKKLSTLYYNLSYFFHIFFKVLFEQNSIFISFLSKSNFYFFFSGFILCGFRRVYFSYRNHHALWTYSDKLILQFSKFLKLTLLTNSAIYYRLFRMKSLSTYYTPNLLVTGTNRVSNYSHYRFISVCRGVPSKRVVEMLEFVEFISYSRNRKIEYLLYLRQDDNDYLRVIRNKIESLKGRKNLNIKFLLDKTPDYTHSNFLLHFSDKESSSNVIFEAISNSVYPILYWSNINSFYSKFLEKKLVIKDYGIVDFERVICELDRFKGFDFSPIIEDLEKTIEISYKFLFNES